MRAALSVLAPEQSMTTTTCSAGQGCPKTAAAACAGAAVWLLRPSGCMVPAAPAPPLPPWPLSTSAVGPLPPLDCPEVLPPLPPPFVLPKASPLRLDASEP